MTINNLIEVLKEDTPSKKINEEELFELIPEFKRCKGFNQNNPWHPYDVYDHIMHVVDNVDNNIILRITALFHDIGKPEVYTEDEQGIGHFYNHWTISMNIFNKYADKYNIDNKELISKLIYYHDKTITKEDTKSFTKEEIELLFKIKKADLLAQSKEYHYLLEKLDKQKENILRSDENELSKM